MMVFIFYWLNWKFSYYERHIVNRIFSCHYCGDSLFKERTLSFYIALDFGGSSVKCAVMDHCAMIIEQFHLPSRVASFEQWFEHFDPYFHHYQDKYSIVGIAMSACGAVDVETGFIHGKSSLYYLHGVDVISLFTRRYHVPVELENDACCAALAEKWLGVCRDSEHFCLVVIGSGVGGAIVTKGEIQKGHRLHGGEFGYAIFESLLW